VASSYISRLEARTSSDHKGFVLYISRCIFRENCIALASLYPVELLQITHHYSGEPVLADVSLAFEANRVTVILGKSGSGKSTLLQIINGMIKPGGGHVRLFGEPMAYNDLQKVRLKMGYVVQQVGLFPHLTIYENIALLGNVAHRPADVIRKRVIHLMDMVKLPLLHLDKYPYQLSGGEQQRAGLCRAMLLEPPVLLMDEPFAALDYETKHAIYDHLLAIQKQEPRTIILVSHDLEEARLLADKVVWLQNGATKMTGDVSVIQSIQESYRNGK
jgi:osmoprotectant transport system ATP-binding protein